MRQAVIVAPDRFEVVTAPVPVLQGADEILVRTVACGICSGDLMPWYLAKKIGTVLGHEVVGRAVEVGQAVAHVRPGDLVFMHHHAPCGDCADCRRGAAVHCRAWRTSHLDPGGMAEWVRVPGVNVRGDTFAVNDLSPERAVFIEPLGCCVKALGNGCNPRRAGSVSDRRAPLPVADAPGSPRGVVVGCGVMGLLNVEAALALGAARVDVVEPDAERRRAALARGAATALTPADAAHALAGVGDFVVIGPGQAEVIRQSLTYVRDGGAAILFTPTSTGAVTPLDLGDLYFREISLIPSYSCGPDHTRHAYELLRQGRVRPESLVTHRFALEGVQQAYDTARSGGAVLKVLVTFPEEVGA
jgi:L-iditol 2-dehydrogenase